MNNLMIDLETLDTVPGGVILSIGAVFFDPDSDTLGETFYAVINTKASVAGGLTISEETLVWWQDKDLEARKVLDAACSPYAPSLREVLTDFNNWVANQAPDKLKVWGKGSDFDNAFLAVAYRKAGLDLPWGFRNNRCFRTLKSLPFLQATELPQLAGIAHNALDDAKHQALCATILLRKLSAMGGALEFVERGASQGVATRGFRPNPESAASKGADAKGLNSPCGSAAPTAGKLY